MSRSQATAIILGLLVQSTHGFLPGVKPRTYPRNSLIEIRAQSLVSSLPGQVSYPFHSFPFCKPEYVTQELASLGDIVLGDVTENTAINVTTAKSSRCQKLCTVKLSRRDRRFMDELISNRYNLRLLADDLPGLGAHRVASNSTLKWFSTSVPVGTIVRPTGTKDTAEPVKLINNVFKLGIDLTVDDSDPKSFLIQQFSVSVVSSAGNINALSADTVCDEEYAALSPLVLNDSLEEYSVFLQVDFSPTKFVSWTERWNRWITVQREGYYAEIDDSNTSEFERESLNSVRQTLRTMESRQEKSMKWFSVMNSAVVVVLLSAIVGAILLRTLLRDIATYNQLSASEPAEFAEESGWKLLHADVFRKPKHFTILSAWVGCGLQLMTMGLVLALLATLGFISPYFSKAQLVAHALVAWAFSGYVAGYSSSRLYGSFQSAVNWRMTTVRTAVIWPGITLVQFVATNLVLTFLNSAAALPLGLVGFLAFLWLGVSIPLLLLGSYHGYRQAPISLPVKTGKIPRHLTQAEPRLTKALKCLVCGIPPFAAVLAEYIYMVSAARQMRSYLLIGYALFSACVLVITCAEISVAMTYLTLSHEDYNWWWPAFFSAASTALYTFGCMAIHPVLLAKYAMASMKPAVFLVWIGYTSMTAYTMFVVCGTIGFVASFVFVRAIFSSVKID